MHIGWAFEEVICAHGLCVHVEIKIISGGQLIMKNSSHACCGGPLMRWHVLHVEIIEIVGMSYLGI